MHFLKPRWFSVRTNEMLYGHLDKKTSQCLDLILLELVRPRIAPMEKETDQLLNNR